MNHEEQARPADRSARDPIIYIASLADYNAGRLHGSWLAADHSPEELQSATDAMLAESPEPGAGEWAIHDYDNFHGLQLDEYESLATISRLAVGIRTYGRLYALFAGWIGTSEATYEGFEQSYSGQWASADEFVSDWFDIPRLEEDLRSSVVTPLQPYVTINAAALARDLVLNGYLYAPVDVDGIAAFWRVSS